MLTWHSGNGAGIEISHGGNRWMVTQPLRTIALFKHILIAKEDVQYLAIINYLYMVNSWISSFIFLFRAAKNICILLGHISFDPHTIL